MAFKDLLADVTGMDQSFCEKIIPYLDAYQLAKIKLMQQRAKGVCNSPALEEEILHIERELMYLFEMNQPNNN